MNRFLWATLGLLVSTLPLLAAEPPALTFQTKPLGAMLLDVRSGAKMIGGDELTKLLDEQLKKLSGDVKLEGLDLTRPISGYVFITGDESQESKPETVFVIPVTNQDAFLKLGGENETKWEPIKDKKGLYKKDSKDESGTAYLRFVGKSAYMAIYSKPTVLAEDAIVPLEKFTDAKDTSWLTFKFNFTRMPTKLRERMAKGLEEALEQVKNQPVPAEAEEGLKKLTEMSRKMGTRWMNQLKEANEAIFRLNFDNKSGEMAMELGLTGQPGSSLAKDIASRKPSTNRFAGLVNKSTALSLVGSAPLLNSEIAEMYASAMEDQFKMKRDEVPPPFQPLVDELVKGLNRTIKKNELDWGLVLNGPADDGHYTALLGLAFEDTAKLEKEIKTLVKEVAPPEIVDLIKFDVAKVGEATLHLITPPAGQLPPQVVAIFGPEPKLGLALTPKGVLVAFGSDPIGSLKPLVKLEPKPMRALEVKYNTAKLAAIAKAVRPEESDEIIKVLGNKDELITGLFVDLQGGSELKLIVGMNIKLFGPAFMSARGAGSAKP